ncbi:MFS transporter [Streptomyces sp. Ru71]|uniref:MFS transporter n=1 Tax=Streptomyces sp. Ru71 TaxID=2080746 RepID=UPI000CDD85C9|nr:MFS transporter [Streptomyces sp. Ru71]POX55978.1 MFS transporter [Streptomyces sp. Ru71]
MTHSRAHRLALTLYAYAFLDDFVLLYPLYALLFADNGLSVGEISSLFALWSATGVLLEVPSGAWADAVSRRLLLWFGPLLTAAGFTLWVLYPAYWSFALGFILWGTRGALASGALEALIHDELDRLGAADRYARLMGRARAAGLLGVMAATALAGPVFDAGGYPAVGAASVLACLLTATVATRFPENRGNDSEPPESWSATLRCGLATARAHHRVRAALLLVPAVTAIWGALEEYTPLLISATGVPEAVAPFYLLLLGAGATAGGLLAGPAARLRSRGLAALLATAALSLATGAAAHTPAGLPLVAVAFGGFQLATVLADARLQRRLDDATRATVTSLAGLGTDVTTIAVYGTYAALTTQTDHAMAFTALATPYLLTAALLLHGLPRSRA